ncbi:MAG: tetratricopeptide repeat protein [Cyclobacteriaceae bacterium]
MTDAPEPTPKDTEITPSESAPGKRPTKGFRVTRLEKRIGAIFSIMSRAFAIVLIGIAIIFLARELSKDGYVITQVNVPASFEAAGYTGPVVAKRIANQLNEIIRITNTAEIAQEYGDSSDEADISVDMVGMGVPVRAFVELIGNALGIDRKKKITADITLSGGEVILVLNITGAPVERVEVPLDSDLEVSLRQLLTEASEAILKYTNESVLSQYYSNHLRDGEKSIKFARYVLDKHKGNSRLEAQAFAQWAAGLQRMKKLAAAEQKIRQGIEIDSTVSALYTSWSFIYEQRGDFDNAIRMNKKALSFLGPDAPILWKITGFNNMGVNFSFKGNHDSAIYYYKKALALDGKFNFASYNMACEYSLMGDTIRCLDELEKAFAYGFNTRIVLEDEDMVGMLNHPRMKELLMKYAEP